MTWPPPSSRSTWPTRPPSSVSRNVSVNPKARQSQSAAALGSSYESIGEIGGSAIGRERLVGAEVPFVPLRIEHAELARAVVGVLQLPHDLGARGPRALEERVGLVDDDVDRAASRLGARPHGAEHHDPVPE